jgi:hypothetical protein
MQSQNSLTTRSIYVSTSEASLEIARLVAVQLEGEGYIVWIGDHHTDYEWPNIQNVVDDALRFADASALIVIEGGDQNKLEAAKERGKPVFFLNVGESLTNLLAELGHANVGVVSLDLAVSPRPRDSANAAPKVSADGAKRQRWILIGTAVLLNIPLVLAMVSMYPVRLPTLADWIQLFILPTVLVVSGWAYSDLAPRAAALFKAK